jgi:hypothetical protein
MKMVKVFPHAHKFSELVLIACKTGNFEGDDNEIHRKVALGSAKDFGLDVNQARCVSDANKCCLSADCRAPLVTRRLIC